MPIRCIPSYKPEYIILNKFFEIKQTAKYGFNKILQRSEDVSQKLHYMVNSCLF